jgi:hypothetical protein
VKRRTEVVRNHHDLARVLQLMRLAFEARVQGAGKHLIVTVADYRKPSTPPQQGTAHMWFAEIGKQSGHTPAEIKDELKDRYLPKVQRQRFGRVVLEPKSMTELDRQETTEFMDQIQAFAAEWGFELTQPDDRYADVLMRNGES